MNVSKTVDKDLCVSCGVCATICPTDAIDFVFERGIFVPKINDKCIECDKCLKVCPSYRVDASVYDKESILSGKEIESYTLYTKNTEIRMNSASGGVITQLIINLLEKGIYEKACVVGYDRFTGERACSEASSDIQQIIKSAKSKYIPVSIDKVAEEIKRQPDIKMIVVATPCQLLALKSFLKLSKLSDENLLIFGLFCERTLNYNIYTYYQKQFGLKFKQKQFGLKFRAKADEQRLISKGWPGDSLMFGKTRLFGKYKEQFIDRSVRMSLKSYF